MRGGIICICATIASDLRSLDVSVRSYMGCLPCARDNHRFLRLMEGRIAVLSQASPNGYANSIRSMHFTLAQLSATAVPQSAESIVKKRNGPPAESGNG